MKWFIGNLFSMASLMGMVLVTLFLAGMILWSGIDMWEAVKDSRWGRTVWEFVCILVWVYWSVVWVRDGVDWWIATDHKLQRRFLGRAY